MRKTYHLFLAAFLSLVSLGLRAAANEPEPVDPPSGDNVCTFSSLDLSKVTCLVYETVGVKADKNTYGNDMVMKNRLYTCGVGVHAPSVAIFRVNGAKRFITDLGIDDGADLKDNHGVVNYVISGYASATAGPAVLASGTINRTDEEAVKIDIDLTGYEFLKCDMQTGSQNWADHVDYGNAYFEYEGTRPVTVTATEMANAGNENYVTLPDAGREGEEIIPLSSLDITKMTCGWGTPKKNLSIDGNPLTLKGIVYASGVGTHASSRIIVKLNGAVTHFVGSVGIDDEVAGFCKGSSTNGVADYRVILKAENGDEKVMGSGTIRSTDTDVPTFDIDCNGWKYLILEALDGGSDAYDHIDWVNAYFEYMEQNSTPPAIVSEEEVGAQLACATTVFSQPGVRFMQKIRASSPAATLSVSGLPEGLTWNAKRQLVEGIINETGVYTYTVTVQNDGNTENKEITLTVSDELQQPVPFMGWLSWNVIEGNISETVVRTVADRMVDLGLADAGYRYLVMDDLWHAKARESGTNKPLPDAAKFPNGLKPVADYVHGKGLKFGIYSDAADRTCAGAYGSFGYEEIDARQYAEWGVDLLKYDYCFAPADVETSSTRYKTMGDALKNSGRNILFYMCEWGVREPWKWGAETGATTWRCTYDTRDCWVGVNGGIGITQSINGMKDLWAYSGPNRFNDADMMCVGIHGTGKSSSDLCQKVGMTQTEYKTQFALWCMWSSPLTLSFDLTKDLSAADRELITNEELIALNQDRMGQQAEFIGEENSLQTYMKDLENGDVAVAVVNLGAASKSQVEIDFSTLPALESGKQYLVRDLWKKEDVGTFTDSYTIPRIASHETKVFRLSPATSEGIDEAASSAGSSVKVSVTDSNVGISLPGAEGTSKRVLISDTAGRVLRALSTTATRIDVPLNAPAGTYVVNVISNARSQSAKFIF